MLCISINPPPPPPPGHHHQADPTPKLLGHNCSSTDLPWAATYAVACLSDLVLELMGYVGEPPPPPPPPPIHPIITNTEALGHVCSSTDLPWAANYAVACPTDPKLVGIVGDAPEAMLWDSSSRKQVADLNGHLDYSFAAAWHPDGNVLATGNQARPLVMEMKIIVNIILINIYIYKYIIFRLQPLHQ